MKRLRWLTVLVALLCVRPLQAQQLETFEPTPSISLPGFELIFADEFDEPGLNLDVWSHRYTNRAYLAGYNTPNAIVQPGDGRLHLTTRDVDGRFLTGMIQSVEAFQYGYFEASIRFQVLQGHHGAFWLQSPLYGRYLDDPGQSGAEIDIIEFFGEGRSAEDAQHNVYWNAYNSDALEQRGQGLYYRENHGEELSTDFHRFGLLWTSAEYIFIIDGVETWRMDEGLSHRPQNIVLSLVTSAWENDRLDTALLPDTMLVDYVRVFRPTE